MKSVVLISLLIAAALALPLEGDVVHIEEEIAGFSLQNRITGGEEANPNQFPYQVALVLSKIKEGRLVYSLCGGSLISDQVVLTAAHCLVNALGGIVMLGAHNREASAEPGRIVLKVSPHNMVVHEDYNARITRNDIALINLPMKIQLTENIQTINLPRRSQNFEGITGTISGWGKTGDSALDVASSTLQYVSRQILPNERCEQVYLAFHGKSQVCVDGSSKKSACPGDSGGPLAIDEADGTKTLVGLTSYGRIQGCQKNYPIAYTRVSAYLDWIVKQTGIKITE